MLQIIVKRDTGSFEMRSTDGASPQNSSMAGRLWSLVDWPPETAKWVTVWLAIR